MTAYTQKDYTHLLGTPGFSDVLLTNHFTLYAGYVTQVNKLSEKLRELPVGTPEYAEIARRFGWEWNGMRLHEYYFGNMSKSFNVWEVEGALSKKLSETWGSRDVWEKDFRAVGALRGIGWAILAYDRESDRLFNVWIGEHDMGHLAGATPILVMDVFEHAFASDYGIKRADYIASFMKAVDWREAEKRLADVTR